MPEALDKLEDSIRKAAQRLGKKDPVPKALSERIQQINWHHGRGDLIGIVFDAASGRGIATFRCTSFLDKARFTVRGKTVYIRGHRSDFSKPLKLR